MSHLTSGNPNVVFTEGKQVMRGAPQEEAPKHITKEGTPANVDRTGEVEFQNTEPADNVGIQATEATPPVQQENAPTRRSTRVWKPSRKYLESIESNKISLPTIDEEDEVLKYTSAHGTMIDDVHPVALLSKVDQDTMYWDQAIKANDRDQFIEAAMKEVQTHVDNKHWVPIALEDGSQLITGRHIPW
jgi:hypothetical protein